MDDGDLQGSVEMFRATITAGQTAMKSAILINGGAAVAVLAFVPSLFQMKLAVGWFSVGLLCFAFGALLGAIAAGCAYLAQGAYATYFAERDQPGSSPRPGHGWNTRAVVLVIASYICFVVGCFIAFLYFLQWKAPQCG